MKPTKKHFEIFKKECLKWIDRLELNGWEIQFGWTEKEGVFSSLGGKLIGRTVTFFLCKDWSNTITPLTESNIRKTAKHEVIHLLLLRFTINAVSRYVTSDELEEAEEEIVRKLEKIIK